ncbi:MAG: GNAT family N-acetyltransferase [Cytophagales bacterium]|nr:GNAT family N-acetyltransferase [Armatimonadota bacterium]
MNPALSIQPEPPNTAEAVALLAALDACLSPLYPPENRHGLSAAALQDASVVFLIARWDSIAVGCGAVRFVGGDRDYAEVKRMFVAPQWRGRGVAQALLVHMEQQTRQKGVCILRLETGIHQPAAIRLYEQVGFSRCAVFGSYLEDGVSLCYEKRLAPADAGQTLGDLHRVQPI